MRIASVSFWHLHGADYARAAVAHPDFDLVAGWDADPERGRSAAQEFGFVFVEDLEDLLADPTIEGVIVCTETSQHPEIVLRCIAAGKHVFMEKVLAADPADARRIVDAARDAGIALTVSMWRSDTGYAAQIAELVAGSAVGTVTSARIRDGHPFALSTPQHPHGTLPQRFYVPETAHGGALIDLCHPVYLTAMLLGLPDRVTAAFGHVTERAVEDNAAVLMSYSDGAIAIAETTYVSSVTPFSIEIHGTEGSILYTEPGIGAWVAARSIGKPERIGPDDVPRLRIRSTRDQDRQWREIAVRPDSPTALLQWLSHAQSGTRDDTSLDLALALTTLVDAAYRSESEGRTVVLDDVARAIAL